MNDRVGSGVHVIIMCKAPVPGFVKTRLSPPYSADEAAVIHRAMAETVIRRASKLFSNVCIASDDVEHPFFNQFQLDKASQGDGDLGARMTRLMVQAFADGAESVLFLGTDSPHMAEPRLLQAVELLSQFDMVAGPVEDGGYDLIAMNKPYVELFEAIEWGSEHVLSETMKRAEVLGVTVGQLEVSFDLDTAESLERAAAIWLSPVPSPF
jgi:rSAM/selenodomain-associated transferase 1